MKRFHVHVHVEDLGQSIAFYSRLFGAQPSRQESDHAKWMLDDPRVNFAISMRGGKPGVGHLGIQTDSNEELASMRSQAQAADMSLEAVGETTCCYARSDTYWLTDPQGVAWEQFHTLADIPAFNEKKAAPRAPSCRAPGAACDTTQSTAPTRPASCC